MPDLPSLLIEGVLDRETELIAAASEAVRNYCGWHVSPSVTETITIDGPGDGTAFLPSLKVTAISAVTNAGVAIDPAGLEWSEDGRLRAPDGRRWTHRLRGMTVTLTHGHPYSDHLAEIVREIASRAAASPGGLIEASAGTVREKRSLTAPGVAGGVVLMAHEREALSTYVIRG